MFWTKRITGDVGQRWLLGPDDLLDFLSWNSQRDLGRTLEVFLLKTGGAGVVLLGQVERMIHVGRFAF